MNLWQRCDVSRNERCSYLTGDPFSTYLVEDGQARCSGEELTGNPWEVLHSLLGKYPQEHRPDLPPFQGGAAGFCRSQ
ncbi:hypothetical protein [Bradyrhizobium genosp. SA-3]|uniref:hypothetical protein n=1 Tax=Bradyrhizobium genosp. SA-3 TaxID=508868 RepID=UPI003D9B474E